MVQRPHWQKTSMAILIIALFFTLLYFGDSMAQGPLDLEDEERNTRADTGSKLDILYLGKDFLVPTPPGPGNENITTLLAQNQTVLGHNIRDRKFNEKAKPEAILWASSNGVEGITLEIEIFFQTVEDSTIIQDKTYKIVFEEYVTTKNSGIMEIKISSSAYEGEPFDIKYGSDNWCSVYLTIRRTDNLTEHDLNIFCGAYEKASYIRLPYDQTLSFYENEKQKDDSSTPGFSGQSITLALFFCLILYIIKCPRQKPRH